MKQLIIKDQQVIIRKANPTDAQAMIDYLDIIGNESDFLTFGKEGLSITIEQEKQMIENILKTDNALFIVAELDGKIIGNLSFTGGKRARINHVGEFGVSVLKEYWRNGIGEALLTYLIKWARDSGVIRKIKLSVRIDNIRGIQLYKKLGFVEEGIQKKEFQVNGQYYDMVLMALFIEQ